MSIADIKYKLHHLSLPYRTKTSACRITMTPRIYTEKKAMDIPFQAGDGKIDFLTVYAVTDVPTLPNRCKSY
jgi:hypothetical protein